jgi:fibronectin type 3 domain-containing protein
MGAGTLDFGFGGADNTGNGVSTPADRNAYHHVMQARRMGLKWLPGLSWLDVNYTSVVNFDILLCNAAYVGDGAVLYASGGGCGNTGEIADVIIHEWGHGLDETTLEADDASAEGTADVVAMHLSRSAKIGPGFFKASGAPSRDLDRSTTFKGLLSVSNIDEHCPTGGLVGPLGYEVHCEGEIYGQAAWDLAQALVAKHGRHTGWRLSERLFFTSLPDAGGYLPTDAAPVYDAYLFADDDDGNLINGTPNATEIFQAFAAHGMATVELPASPACSRPAQPAAAVVASCDGLEVSWSSVPGVDHYEVLRSDEGEQGPFFPLAVVPPGTTTHDDTTVAPGIDYGYVVLAVDAAGCESTVEGPVPGRVVAPVLDLTAARADDEPLGNRSGGADPGETVDLVLTLANTGDGDATAVSGTLTTTTPGVLVLEPTASWPAIPAGSTADNLDPLRIETDDQLVCGERVRLQLEHDEGSTCPSRTSFFDVLLGEATTLVEHDFEGSNGWVRDVENSTATAGEWIRDLPQGSVTQPAEDTTPDGIRCWLTGQGANDVDGGATILRSSNFDLSTYDHVEVSYARWYTNSNPGVDLGDFFHAEVSPNGGTTWTILESVNYLETVPAWIRRRFSLEPNMLTNQVRFRFVVADGAGVDATVEAAVDDFRLETFTCDPTPACSVAPDFSGIASIGSGPGCGEVRLEWQEASSNCENAAITYDVHRGTDPRMVADETNRIASGLTATGFVDPFLVPGETYHYVVRAIDSRSGGDGNNLVGSASAALVPDQQAPAFGGLEQATPGESCGETVLDWSPASESCSLPVAYEIHRSTDPSFVPGAKTLVASTFSSSFVDVAPTPGAQFSYVVQARDAAGNVDANVVRLDAAATRPDEVFAASSFEADDGGWTVGTPNDATEGEWAWGDPGESLSQPEDDATENGTKAWITGLEGWIPDPLGDNDVDAGSTTLVTAGYDLSGADAPVVRYSRWFFNSPSVGDPEEPLIIEVSDNGGADWLAIDRADATSPVGWIRVSVPLLEAGIATTSDVRFRFTASDLGGDSLLEAGIDDFELVDPSEGCTVCAAPPETVGTVLVGRSGGDVILDWTDDPVQGKRFAVYRLDGAGLADALRVGTTSARSFVHEEAATSGDDFYYRVTAIDACGAESALSD